MTIPASRYPLNHRAIFAILLSLMILAIDQGISKADQAIPSPAATIDGSLNFFTPDGAILVTITIETAETPMDWAKGLMDRKEMGRLHGMLFIFNHVKSRGFWMRNTYIPLDIIFVDEKMQVVTIAEDTIPFSESILPSGKPVKYVVEVNAGFSKQFKIEKGTLIRWKRR